MLALHSLVLGGGGAKGVVYPKVLQQLHDGKEINLRAVPHVVGASAGALTGFILALGGTPKAIAMMSPSIFEALPFATKQFTNASTGSILWGRLTNRRPDQDSLDGSSIPSVLLIWTETALLQILKCIDDVQGDGEHQYLTVDDDRFYLNELNDDALGCFWQYAIDRNASSSSTLIPQLRMALAVALRDLRRFGCYLVSSHHRIVSLLEAAGIDAGWKHLSVAVTRLYSGQRDKVVIAEQFGSANYVSSRLPKHGRVYQDNPIFKAFLLDESICLMSAAQASGAFPLLFQPMPLGVTRSLRDLLYTDGGCMSNVPAEAVIFSDQIQPTSAGDYNILAIGLNTESEVTGDISTFELRIAQSLILPANHTQIIVPTKTSLLTEAKKTFFKMPPAYATEHGYRFKFEHEGRKYKVFYIFKAPISPLALTADISAKQIIETIDTSRDNRSTKTFDLVQRSIVNYADSMTLALKNLEKGTSPARFDLLLNRML